MIVDCAQYKDGARQRTGPMGLEEAAKHRGDGFVWLGLHDPDADELREVAARFDLPELAVEDAMHAHQRPKLEDYDDGYFLVLHTARYLDEREEVEFGEVHVFMSILQANLAVISVQQNDVVKQISGWAAIITVPTLIASVYGMNFEHMPELRWRYGYPACLLLMAVAAILLHRVLRRAGWL